MYYTYLLRCADGALYAGITTDPQRRLRQHRGEIKGGARYTARNKPLDFAALWSAPDRAAASRLEYRLKRLDHRQKEALLSGETIEGLLPEGCARAELFEDPPRRYAKTTG